jgi:hypothetical protein
MIDVIPQQVSLPRHLDNRSAEGWDFLCMQAVVASGSPLDRKPSHPAWLLVFRRPALSVINPDVANTVTLPAPTAEDVPCPDEPPA